MASFHYYTAPRSGKIYCVTGVVGHNCKVYFYMSDVLVLLNHEFNFDFDDLKFATCQLQDICSNRPLLRPDAWVIEFSAFINLLNVQRRWDWYHEFCHGHAKVMYYRNRLPQLTSCERNEGMILKIWVEKLQDTLRKHVANPTKNSLSKPLRL